MLIRRTIRGLLGLGPVLGCALLVTCGPREPPARPPNFVVTDGRFDDWAGIAPMASADATAARDAAIDLGSVWVTDDPAFLHLAIEVGRPANAQAMAGTLIIAFDADADPATGGTAAGMDGVDVVAELSVRAGDAAVGVGTGVRLVGPDGPGPIRPSYDLGLVVSPTHAAPRWELRLVRGTAFGGRRLFAGETVRLAVALIDHQGLRERTPPVAYAFGTPAGPAVGVPRQRLAATPGTVRIVSWNVSGERLRDHPEPFVRMLAALDPDVILLDELWEDVVVEALAALFATPPLAEHGRFEVVLGRSGGRQRAAVASRIGIVPQQGLLDIRYAGGSLDALDREVADPTFSELIAAEAIRGLSVAGAWVGPPDRPLLAVAIDLQSRGHAGSPFDRLRTLQAELLAERIRGVAPAALVIGGDLNLVGSEQPLTVLRGRSVSGGVDLAVAEAYRLTDRSQATWRAVFRARTFGPGRLDYQLSLPATLTIDRAFVFHTAELSQAAQRLHGVRATDADEASQHLPVVVDYRWRSD